MLDHCRNQVGDRTTVLHPSSNQARGDPDLRHDDPVDPVWRNVLRRHRKLLGIRATTGNDGKPGKLENRLGIAPCRQPEELVRAHDEPEFHAGAVRRDLTKCVDGVTRRLAIELDTGEHESGIVPDRGLDESGSQIGVESRPSGLVRWPERRDQPDFVEGQLPTSLGRRDEVTDVDGIKAPAQEPDASTGRGLSGRARPRSRGTSWS